MYKRQVVNLADAKRAVKRRKAAAKVAKTRVAKKRVAKKLAKTGGLKR